MRTLASKTVSDLIEYKGLCLREAADTVILDIIPRLGGDGGLISVDRNGNIAMPFNTPGMFRGYIRGDGVPHVLMYREQ